MQNLKNTSLVILAGGKSSRMGMDKALLTINNKTFLQSIYNNLHKYFGEVIISSNNLKHKIEDVKIIEDEYKNIGPIGGIYTCLKQSKTNNCFFISVDTPFVSLGVIEELVLYISNYDVVIAESNGKINPTIGFYSKNVLKTLSKHINDKNFKLISFLKNVNCKIVYLNQQLNTNLRNINSPEDYKSL